MIRVTDTLSVLYRIPSLSLSLSLTANSITAGEFFPYYKKDVTWPTLTHYSEG